MPESASTRFQSSSAGSRAIYLKHAPERFTIFPIYLPCQNIFGPIHRSQLAHAICIRVVLTYEKHSTVLYERVSERSRVNLCRPGDF